MKDCGEPYVLGGGLELAVNFLDTRDERHCLVIRMKDCLINDGESDGRGTQMGALLLNATTEKGGWGFGPLRSLNMV